MNMDDIDFDDEEDKTLAIEHFMDRGSAALDHVNAAKRAIRRCINVVTDARIDTGTLAGRTLDEHLEQLLEIEGDLGRAEGELADAGPHSRF
jgi:hypothetical protein